MAEMTSLDQTEIFLAVIQQNKGIIYKVANSYCRNPEERQDLFQEIVVQLWQAFKTYNSSFKHSTWIYRISLNVAISFYRKENRRRHISNPLPDGILALKENPMDDEREGDLNLLQQAIAQLRELDRALMLLYLDEKSYREIAQIMGISESNVATKVGRIKIVLRKNFTQLKER
jgi:RNA polymerase sigma factor, sigma-70 family